jgi:hypothetical protein
VAVSRYAAVVDARIGGGHGPSSTTNSTQRAAILSRRLSQQSHPQSVLVFGNPAKLATSGHHVGLSRILRTKFGPFFSWNVT